MTDDDKAMCEALESEWPGGQILQAATRIHSLSAELDTVRKLAREMTDWNTNMDEAPKDELLLLFGLLDPHPDDVALYSRLDRPCLVSGYWDEIDGAWCPMGSTFNGPWFTPTAWMPLPAPPEPQP